MEKQIKRLGIPVARATLVGLFDASTKVLKTILEYFLEQIAASDFVQADETQVKMQEKKIGHRRRRARIGPLRDQRPR